MSKKIKKHTHNWKLVRSVCDNFNSEKEYACACGRFKTIRYAGGSWTRDNATRLIKESKIRAQRSRHTVHKAEQKREKMSYSELD